MVVESTSKATLGRCLVIGAAGFLGRHLVRELRRRGHEVRAIDRAPTSSNDPGLEILTGDLCSPAVAEEACRDVATVFHVAGNLYSYRYGRRKQRRQALADNALAVANVIRASAAAGVRRLVYTSSSVVADENGVPRSGLRDPYSASKLEAERRVLEADGSGALRCCALRPGALYGPGDPTILPRVVRGLGGRVTVDEPGACGFTSFVVNAVDAHIRAACRLGPDSPLAGRSLALSDEAPVNYADFFDPLGERLGFPPARLRLRPRSLRGLIRLWEWCYGYLPLPPPPVSLLELDTLTTRADPALVARSHERLDWSPPVSRAEALDASLPYCRDLLVDTEPVPRPHWGWWLSVFAGMGLLALLVLSDSAYAWWDRHVTSLLSRSLLGWILVAATLTHVYKGLRAAQIASEAGWRDRAGAWGLQTFLLGYPSMRLLRGALTRARSKSVLLD